MTPKKNPAKKPMCPEGLCVIKNIKKNPSAVKLGKLSAKSPKRTKAYYKRLSEMGVKARKKRI